MDSNTTEAAVVTALTSNLAPSALYDTYIAFLPWIGAMAAAGLTIYVIKKLVKGFRSGGKIRM